MLMVTTKEEYDSAKIKDLITLKCQWCSIDFKRIKHYVQTYINQNAGKFCSKKCASESYKTGVKMNCKNCGKEIWRMQCMLKSKKQKNHFCSHHCSGIYTSKNKAGGVNKSKMEIFIQNKLITKYTEIEFLFNKREYINAELDIYIPSLKLAFELNGIFHYEPIFGVEKLAKTKNNDQRKFQACLERGIELCIIDTSKLNNFKEKDGNHFFNIISNIIELKLRPAQ